MIKNSTYLVPIALLIAAFMYAVPDAQVPATGTIAFTGARIVDGTGRAPIETARSSPADASRMSAPA